MMRNENEMAGFYMKWNTGLKWLNMQKWSRSGVFFRNFEHTQYNVQITANLLLFFIALNRYLCTKFYIKICKQNMF